MNKEQVGGIVRAILAGMAGVLVTKGYVDQSTLNTIIGAVVEAGVAYWSYWSNHSTRIEVKK